MECLERLTSHSLTKNDLDNLSVDAPDEEIYRQVLKNWDMVAKPLDSMGRFEDITARIGGILGTDDIDISKKAVIIMCADNGIVAEGISQSGKEVTAAVARKMAGGNSSVGRMAKMIGADTLTVDIGMDITETIPGICDRKIRQGTGNFKYGYAMTQEEAIKAIFTGIDIVDKCKKKGYHILATGEMGIGNTTTSSAVTAALLQCSADEVTGRGAGLCDEKLKHKKQIIAEAIGKYKLYEAEPLDVLQAVGGLDIAGLAGVCIGGALSHIPIVLDGVISLAAALLAERLVHGTVKYLIPSHKGKEPAAEKLEKALDLEPVIYGKMALGEGTGAVMMMSLIELALCLYNKRTSFSDINVVQYERFE